MSIPCPAADGSSERRTKFDAEPPMCIDPAKSYTAEMVTSMGTLTIHLDPTLAPRTVNSFVFLARYHYYDGIIFHRIIRDFVCQGGDPTGTGTGGPGYKFADELPKAGRYEIGSLAMANAGPNTNGSQFFVTVKPTPWLNDKHTIFGEVIEGMDVVEKISTVKTGAQDKPVQDVVLERVEIEEG